MIKKIIGSDLFFITGFFVGLYLFISLLFNIATLSDQIEYKARIQVCDTLRISDTVHIEEMKLWGNVLFFDLFVNDLVYELDYKKCEVNK